MFIIVLSIQVVTKTRQNSDNMISDPGGVGGGVGYFLVKDYWGCASGWDRIFTLD